MHLEDRNRRCCERAAKPGENVPKLPGNLPRRDLGCVFINGQGSLIKPRHEPDCVPCPLVSAVCNLQDPLEPPLCLTEPFEWVLAPHLILTRSSLMVLGCTSPHSSQLGLSCGSPAQPSPPDLLQTCGFMTSVCCEKGDLLDVKSTFPWELLQ